MYILKRLKELREKNGLNQAELAQLLQITRQQYGLYETGKREIPSRYLKILAEFYHTSTDYILEVTNQTKPYKKELQLKIRINNPKMKTEKVR